MTISEGDDELMSPFDRRPVPDPTSPAVKPKGGALLLSFLLRAVVVALALALFFLFAGIAAFVLLLLFLIGRVLQPRRRIFHVMIWQPPEEAPDCRRISCCAYPLSLDDFGEGERCRALPGCSHLFHKHCIDRWLEKSPSCPSCRGRVSPSRPLR